MAKRHGLLLITEGEMSAEETAEQLNISQGNAKANLRSLAVKGLIEMHVRPDSSREFYYAPKDTWTIARQIALERKRLELDPMLRTLEELKKLQGSDSDSAFVKFRSIIACMEKSANSLSAILDIVSSGKQRWFTSKIFRLGK